MAYWISQMRTPIARFSRSLTYPLSCCGRFFVALTAEPQHATRHIICDSKTSCGKPPYRYCCCMVYSTHLSRQPIRKKLSRADKFSYLYVHNNLVRSISWQKQNNQNSRFDSDWSVLISWWTVLIYSIRTRNWCFTLRLPIYTEATSLDVRKTQSSARLCTKPRGKFHSCLNISQVGTTLFFSTFHAQSTPLFFIGKL
jgi:hypothetical protein